MCCYSAEIFSMANLDFFNIIVIYLMCDYKSDLHNVQVCSLI